MQDLQKQILSDYNITVHAYPDNIIDDISGFLNQINNITSLNEGSVIQLLDCDYVCGVSHINQAISQAIKAFDEKQNFANDLGLEICVRLSAQKQINKALKLLGIKNKTNVLVIYINSSDKQVEMVEELLTPRDDNLIEEYDVDAIVKAYKLDDNCDVINRVNEKIALLALKS